MSWLDYHRAGEAFAAQAQDAVKQRDFNAAREKYRLAADAETQALASLEPNKIRTRGITAVSAVSLWFKGDAYDMAEALACRVLAEGRLPEFAITELRGLIQSIWMELSKKEAGVSFLPGQVLVSVKGGQVITGGAPLDLIVEKVQTVQALFYRTIEYVKGLPHRNRGAADRSIQESCRPWLFQAAPGSYQFAVGIEKPKQRDFFETTEPQEIADRFLMIVAAATSDDPALLPTVVPDQQYRTTFLKLSRNLAPSGKSFTDLEIKSAGELSGITLGTETRSKINKSLRGLRPKLPLPDAEPVTLTGVLRAVHLDEDWIEVTTDTGAIRVTGLQDTIDDVIGPMVNHRVEVTALRLAQKITFIDIEGLD